MITCLDCGKEFNRRYNMEHHRCMQYVTAYDGDNTGVSTEDSHSDTDQVKQNRDLPGARPTNDISIEFEIRSKLRAL